MKPRTLFLTFASFLAAACATQGPAGGFINVPRYDKDTLWELPGEQLDLARRAWLALMPFEPDASISEFVVSYEKDSDGESILYFFKPNTNIQDVTSGNTQIARTAKGYTVVIDGAHAKVFRDDE